MVSHHSRGIVTKKDKGKTWGKCRAHINQEEFKAYRGREGKIIASLRGLDYGVEVIMSSVKGLLDKCEDLSSVPRNHAFHRHRGEEHKLVIPVLGNWRQVDPWSSLASLAYLVSSRTQALLPKNKMDSSRRTLPMADLWLLHAPHECAQTCYLYTQRE